MEDTEEKIMRNVILTLLAVLLALGLVACGSVPEGPYFAKGVYACYEEGQEEAPKTYFYVFEEDNYGYTEDGANDGLGLPFDAEESDGIVRFTFGGADEPADVLTITGVQDGKVFGTFSADPERKLVFEPMKGFEPDTFSAENYVNPNDSIYHDANGWSVHYDAAKFAFEQDGPKVYIVYIGESAGTNMITVTYTVDTTGEEVIRELGESWGADTEYYEGIFPGTDAVNGYWAVLPPAGEGSGIYMTAIGRDYMEGSLVFELTGHNGEDEEMNLAVSDELAGVIDSLSFDYE